MKKVVVTGATRGIGLAITQHLLRENYDVIGLSRTSTPDFEKLAIQYPNQLRFVPHDMSDLDATEAAALQLIKQHGSIYGLINNAARGLDGLLTTTHQRDIESALRTNLLGPITLTKILLRNMLLKREGRIVNISSTAASNGFSGLSVYSATKGGLEAFSRSLAREAGKRNVTVNCIAPGFIETAMTSSLQGEKRESILRRTPLRLATVDDVAAAVVFLLSPGASSISGTTITVDGGASA